MRLSVLLAVSGRSRKDLGWRSWARRMTSVVADSRVRCESCHRVVLPGVGTVMPPPVSRSIACRASECGQPKELAHGTLPSSAVAQEDQCGRRYLEVAPPGPRTEGLAASCVLRIATTPVAARDRYGDVITIDELRSAAGVVGETMAQDRDLSAWIARKVAVQLNFALTGDRTDPDMSKAGLTSNAILALQAVGIRPAGSGAELEFCEAVDLPVADRDRALDLDLAKRSLAVLIAAVGEPSRRQRRLFEDLYAGARGSQAERDGYEITAWTSILIGRLISCDIVPAFDRRYRDIPAMSEAGWYPNPGTTGQIVGGDPQFQRFWDGAHWTDRARVRQSGRWIEQAVPLHAAPG
jgi:hypothetical protein